MKSQSLTMCNKRVANPILPGTRLVVMLLLLLVTSQSVWAEVRASLNRSIIPAGDTVTLIITSTGKDPGGEPDLGVLEQDFEILGTSTSQQIQFINGKRSGKREWQVELAPLHDGEIKIPAITVGSTHTTPLTLTVSDQPSATAAAATGEPVFLKALVEPVDADSYVQQQLNYTLQLYYREPLMNGSFEGPEINNALVERLGEDVRYTTRVNGVEYQVVERRYALFPEESGELVIPAVVFDGYLRTGSGRRMGVPGLNSMLDEFMSGMPFGGTGKRIRVRSEAQTVQIKPRPRDYSGNSWLPAAELSLHDSWADGPPEFHVGEPVTRTLTLEAKGLEGSQLPPLGFPDVTGMRLYPEQPVQENHSDGKWVYGSSSQSVAYVPSASGKLSIPEIRVDWWDTGTRQQRTAVLPAWEINVLPGAAGASPPAPAAAPVAPPAPANPAAPVTAVTTSTAPAENGWRGLLLQYWPWLAGVVLLTAGVLGILRLTVRSRRRAEASAVHAADTEVMAGNKQQRQAALADLQAACSGNQPQTAARALLQLAEIAWPTEPPRSLEALARRLPAAAGLLRALERVLYSAGETPWDGAALWECFRNGLPAEQATGVATEPGLAPLYPNWDRQGN
jgi:hypothetical protein